MPAVAGDFLVDLARRLELDLDSTALRATVEHACGGEMRAVGPDGDRASTMTISGIPFEVSVSGGRGKWTPAVRYMAETATQETVFGSRVAASSETISTLAARLPVMDARAADLLQTFLATLYPEPAAIPPRYRSAAWIGIVHHVAAPAHIARLKLYGGLKMTPDTLDRLCTVFPGFAGLIDLPRGEQHIIPIAAALEVDARGTVTHKIYSRALYGDVAVPMKLARYFGEPAREVLAEFVRCGIAAPELHRQNFFVCSARGAGDPVVALSLGASQGQDLTPVVRELASRHHGSTCAVDALVYAAQESGAIWHYSAVGLAFAPEHGLDKLNVYGTPTWNSVLR
ncbi:hypothetical protein AB0M34_10205 [Nocardia sp. NPDC050193]